MSWLYSQVLVAEYSEANSLAGAPSALSSASPTPQAYLPPDRMTAFSRLSRFGMMFAPLTDDHGAELLTWFLAGFLAKTSAQPEREQALTELEADCGKKWRGLLVKWDQDMFSSKTVLCSEQEDSTLFSKTLPKWGMMLDGECWELPMPDLPNTGTEFGSWHTPQANEDAAGTPAGKMQKMLGNDPRIRGTTPEEWARGTLNPVWVEWLMGWPLGWTDLKPSATDKFQQWLYSHGMS